MGTPASLHFMTRASLPVTVSEDSELADNSEPGGASEVEETPARQKRPYEDYVIEDPEDMDDAPDTGDMFDDEELYGDDDYFAEEKAKTRKGRRRSRHGGISGGVLALLWAVFLILPALRWRSQTLWTGRVKTC